MRAVSAVAPPSASNKIILFRGRVRTALVNFENQDIFHVRYSILNMPECLVDVGNVWNRVKISVIFVLIYFLVLVLVFQLFFRFSFVLVFVIFSF